MSPVPEENTFAAALDRVSRINFVYDRRDDLMRVSGVEDIEKGLRSGKPSVMFHLAGVGCFAEAKNPLTNLDLFYALGVRMSQLTYIQDNALCCFVFAGARYRPDAAWQEDCPAHERIGHHGGPRP